MAEYITKREVYARVDHMRDILGISNNAFNLDVKSICTSTGEIDVEEISLKTDGLRGIAIPGEDNEHDIILLNSTRRNDEQNFDCSHELYHIAYHRGRQKIFRCDELAISQNNFLEYQANEGGAEFVVPYRAFVPMICDYRESLKTFQGIFSLRESLSTAFGVTETVIKYRMEALKYEIHQYLDGVPIDEIQILSNKQQSKIGINIKSINDTCDDLLSEIRRPHRIRSTSDALLLHYLEKLKH